MELSFEGIAVEDLSFEKFCDYLKQFSTQEKSDFDAKIIKTKAQILGIKSSDIKNISKYLLKSGYENLLKFPKNKVYETDLILGKTLAADKKRGFSEREEMLADLMSTFDNWALCDGTVSCLKYSSSEYGAVKAFAKRLISCEKEFEIRCGIIILLDCVLPAGETEAIIDMLSSVPYGRYYYVDIACAWLLATALIRHKNVVLDFLENCKKINDFTYIKTFQKAKESYRISLEDKLLYSELIKRRKLSAKDI